MLLIRRFTFLLLLMLPVLCCYGWQGPSQKAAVDTFTSHIKSSLSNYYKKYPVEKVFVHTNMDIYTTGETIWYKIYAMAYGKPSALSRIIYVQLTDTAGNVIAQNKLPLSNGIANGNIDIGRQLTTGWYKLSAFTSWMMNFGRESYYQQKIFIKNLSSSTTVTEERPVSPKKYHISFYPEGGDLIDGMLSKIAFRAYDDEGTPANVNGNIRDNANSVIAQINTVHDGMGLFSLEGAANVPFVASVQFPDGSKQEVKLPQAAASGICMQAVQDQAAVQLTIAYAGAAPKFQNCTLVAFQNSGQVVAYPLKLEKGGNLFSLNKADFTTGILRLTIFNSDKLPCAERIIFINKHDIQSVQIKPDTLSFIPGARNSFSLALRNEGGRPVNGNFSIAVTDADAFDKPAPGQNIFSALQLSPELNGEINEPGYYFKNTSDSLARQLDLVMLTHGWRHFVWQKILNNVGDKLKYPVEKSQYIAGNIAGYKPPKGPKDKNQVRILVMNQDSTKFIGYITPDSSGSFIMKDFNHKGLSDVYLQATDKKDRPEKLTGKLFTTIGDSLKQAKGNGFTPEAVPVLNTYYTAGAKAEEDARLQTEGVMLRTINIKSTKTTPAEKLIREHVSAKYQSPNEFTLDLVHNHTVNIGIINYIRGRFPGLQIIGDDARAVFIYHGGNTLGVPALEEVTAASAIKTEMGIGLNNNLLPYFYLNEVPINFVDIKDISLDNVALIRFMPPPVGFAPYNGGNSGALMIYTKRQSDEITMMKGMADYDHFIFNGYSITREFNAPDYSKAGLDRGADNRIALHWFPDIETNNNGVVKFHFYNSGRAKKFRIIVQGMDVEGRLLYAEQVF